MDCHLLLFTAHGIIVYAIEDPYLSGVSLTHGLPGSQYHIWSSTAGKYRARVRIYLYKSDLHMLKYIFISLTDNC